MFSGNKYHICLNNLQVLDADLFKYERPFLTTNKINLKKCTNQNVLDRYLPVQGQQYKF